MKHNTMGYKTIKFNTAILIYPASESEKMGNRGTRFLRKVCESEEGWDEILILPSLTPVGNFIEIELS